MKSILVTGAAGFIGSHAVEALLDRGYAVVGIDNFEAASGRSRKRLNAATLLDHPMAERLVLHEVDIRDTDAIARLCRWNRFDAIVHLAALAGVRASIDDSARYFDVNVLGSVGLLEAARKAGIGHFVFASTSSVYGEHSEAPFEESLSCVQPLSPYAASKRAVELAGATYAHLHGIAFTALRFFTVYGPRNRPDMMAYKLLQSITEDLRIPLYNGGTMFRDWTYVDDIVKGLVAAVDRPLDYEVINLGRGQPVQLREFITILESLAGRSASLNDEVAPRSEVRFTHASINKARRLLDYEPTTSVLDGAQMLWRWYRKLPQADGAAADTATPRALTR